MDDALERHPGLRFGLQALLSATTPEEYVRRERIVEALMAAEEEMRASKGKPRDDADKREEEDERGRDESEPVEEPEHSALHVTDPRKGESTSEQTMVVEVAKTKKTTPWPKEASIELEQCVKASLEAGIPLRGKGGAFENGCKIHMRLGFKVHSEQTISQGCRCCACQDEWCDHIQPRLIDDDTSWYNMGKDGDKDFYTEALRKGRGAAFRRYNTKATEQRKNDKSEQTMAVELTTRPHPTLPGSTPCDPSHKKCAKCGRYERHRFRKGTKDLQCVRCYQTAYREKQRNNKELQADVDTLAVQIMEAAEQRKKNKDRLELLLSTEATEETKVSAGELPLTQKLPRRKPGTGRRAATNNPWTRDEEEALRTGIQEIGRGRWQDIMNHPALSKRLTNRSAVDLKDKWRNMCMKSDKEEHSPPSPNQRKNDQSEQPPLLLKRKRRRGKGVTSSTSGLEELAMLAALEQPAASKRPRGDDEDVEKFTDFEEGHLVFARTGKANWAPAQISAISTSAKGHQVYDVEFFVKENGVYPRAQNLPLSKLEAADEDTFEKHSGRRKESENWVEGMEKFRGVYDKSRPV